MKLYVMKKFGADFQTKLRLCNLGHFKGRNKVFLLFSLIGFHFYGGSQFNSFQSEKAFAHGNKITLNNIGSVLINILASPASTNDFCRVFFFQTNRFEVNNFLIDCKPCFLTNLVCCSSTSTVSQRPQFLHLV